MGTDTAFAFIPRILQYARFEVVVLWGENNRYRLDASWNTSGLASALRQLQEGCPSRGFGHWRLYRTDHDTSFVELQLGAANLKFGITSRGTASYGGPFPPVPSLRIRCSLLEYNKGKLWPYIHWNEAVHDDGMSSAGSWRYPQGTMLFGDESPIRVEWELPTRPREWIGRMNFPNEYRSDGVGFVNKLMESNRFHISLSKSDGSVIQRCCGYGSTLANALAAPLDQRTQAPSNSLCQGRHMHEARHGKWIPYRVLQLHQKG